METRNGQASLPFKSLKSAIQRSKQVLTGILLLSLLLGTSCTKGADLQCGDPENPCDEIITEEIVDY